MVTVVILTQSPVYTRTPTMYLHFKMDPNSQFTQAIPKGWASFAYILSGTAMFGKANMIAI